MRERTVSVSSAGKTFSVTGWKIGWVTGPAELVAAVRTAKQFLTYTSGAPFQPAVAAGLRLGQAPLDRSLQAKRDLLCAGLGGIGFDVFPPAGTYFVTTDIRPLGFDDGLESAASCRAVGVVAIPIGVLDDRRRGGHLVRWAFCKRDEVLDEALERLGKAFG